MLGIGIGIIFTIFILRISGSLAALLCLIANTKLTPVLVLSTVFSLTNLVSRSVSMLAPYVSHNVDNPLITVTLLSSLGLVAAQYLE